MEVKPDPHSSNMAVKQDPDGPPPYQTPIQPWGAQPISIDSTPDPTQDSVTLPQEQHDIEMTSAFNDEGIYRDLPTRNAETHNQVEDDAMQHFGASSRQLIASIQKIESLGIKATLPSLPKWVVVGDQSAGKSSIIEALCDIRLPRGEGTCTRCPYKITTTSSKGAGWICKISIHQRYLYDPAVRGKKHSVYNNWVESEEVSITEIATVHNKDDIELALRRAQLAILNPGSPATEFIDCDISACLASNDLEAEGFIETPFSPNWVALDIASSDLPELSMYDLPGAINVYRDDDKQHLVTFIQDLLKSYMLEEKTLILIACPMTSDIENTTAYRYIRQCKALNRCMGVRTKPDMVNITPRRLQQEKALLDGREFRLGGGGWFITKQCSQEEVEEGNITHAEARKREEAFFAQEVWKETLGTHASRLGIQSLQMALSECLTDHIRHEIPAILDRVQTRRTQVKHELSQLPPPEENAQVTAMKELDKLRDAMTRGMERDSIESDQFNTTFRDIFRKFSQNLKKLTPDLKLVTPGFVPHAIELNDDEEDSSPSKRVRISESRGANTTPTRTTTTPRQRRTPKSKAQPVNAVTPQLQMQSSIDLEELEKRFNSAPGANIPGQLSDRVIRQLMHESMRAWETTIGKLIESIEELLRTTVSRAFEACLSARKGTAFYDAANQCAADFLKEVLPQQNMRISDTLSAELDLPFTISNAFSREMEAARTEYGDQRNLQRVTEYYDQHPDVKSLSEAEKRKKATDRNWVAQNLGADDYDREISGFIRVVAYYNTAYPQLVDKLFKDTHYHLIRVFPSRLARKLEQDLSVGDPMRCEQLLLADQRLVKYRQGLLTEDNKLRAALEELQSLG